MNVDHDRGQSKAFTQCDIVDNLAIASSDNEHTIMADYKKGFGKIQNWGYMDKGRPRQVCTTLNPDQMHNNDEQI